MLGIEKYRGKIILIAFLFIIFLIFANIFSYFDIVNFCYISINGDFWGNEKTIRAAIKLLKKEDRESYKTLCLYIDEIVEKRCLGSDPFLSKEWRGWEESGCYIKGSRVIYLKPDNGNTESVIRRRAEDLKKYSNYSKDFWNNLE